MQSADQASLRTTESPPDVLRAGQPAPLFSLPDADMETVDLSQFRGKKHARKCTLTEKEEEPIAKERLTDLREGNFKQVA